MDTMKIVNPHIEKTQQHRDDMRLEYDSIGSKYIPCEAYYGIHAARALENFHITGKRMHPEMIKSIAQLKKACAITNASAGVLNQKIAKAIEYACDKIIEGNYHDQFIVDPIQGSAGTSMNMNANEVIANIAIESLGKDKGDYAVIHPNDHVNFGQSTNDVIPTAGKITAIVLLHTLEKKLKTLKNSFAKKAKEFDSVIKMGRTQLQDAVPIRLGQEFHAYATVVDRGIKLIKKAENQLYTINMGGTAVGTGLNADDTYFSAITQSLADITGIPFRQAEDLIDATQNIDCFASVSSAIKNCAISISKIANDLRLMSSGPKTGLGEINLPAKQNGSSIMPGKVNPVIPEVVSQVAFKIVGNDVTITMAVEAGQLELNAFEPVVFDCLFESIDILSNAVDTFVDNCIEGITANEERCRAFLNSSVGIITALCPHIGYTKSAELAKEALAKNISVRDLILSENILDKKELDIILNAYNMTTPGISGKELILDKIAEGA
jgi:aspartate ammonia-lyase